MCVSDWSSVGGRGRGKVETSEQRPSIHRSRARHSVNELFGMQCTMHFHMGRNSVKRLGHSPQ